MNTNHTEKKKKPLNAALAAWHQAALDVTGKKGVIRKSHPMYDKVKQRQAEILGSQPKKSTSSPPKQEKSQEKSPGSILTRGKSRPVGSNTRAFGQIVKQMSKNETIEKKPYTNKKLEVWHIARKELGFGKVKKGSQEYDQVRKRQQEILKSIESKQSPESQEPISPPVAADSSLSDDDVKVAPGGTDEKKDEPEVSYEKIMYPSIANAAKRRAKNKKEAPPPILVKKVNLTPIGKPGRKKKQPGKLFDNQPTEQKKERKSLSSLKTMGYAGDLRVTRERRRVVRRYYKNLLKDNMKKKVKEIKQKYEAS